ncbi:MAG: hypothetical protein ACK45H_03305 [Bacteroidota bacterium]|jgi:tetrahydromethanopterin S-methyltransferase subunit C
MKVILRWFIAALILGAITAMFWGPETSREVWGYIAFGTGFWMALLSPMLKELKEQPLTPSKFKTMKVILIWFIAALMLGSITAMFWGPDSWREVWGFLAFGTGFWMAMLAPMLHTKE